VAFRRIGRARPPLAACLTYSPRAIARISGRRVSRLRGAERTRVGRARRWAKVVLTAVSTTVLVWMPTATQAGLTVTVAD
jgi:hypothetical protein